jgi:hypothetical protein
MAEMETQLTEREFLARDSLQVEEVYYEIFSHVVGDQTEELRLNMEAMLLGTAVDLTQATGLVYELLSADVPPGYTLVASSIEFEQDEVLDVDAQGRVIFTVNGAGLVAAELELADSLAMISGQETDLAVAYLNEQLPLEKAPEIHVWPTWFDRLPYVLSRIETDVVNGE